jgi:hypothetical protein
VSKGGVRRKKWCGILVFLELKAIILTAFNSTYYPNDIDGYAGRRKEIE